MLQVTASNHPGPAMLNGASVTCGLMAYRPSQNSGIWRNLDRGIVAPVEPAPHPARNLLDPRPQAWDSTQAETPGSNPGPRVWGRAVFSRVQGLLDPGKNAWVEQKSAMA